jgi:hypothetical protein
MRLQLNFYMKNKCSLFLFCFQIQTREKPSVKEKIVEYFSKLWNSFDVTINGLFILSIILRLTLPDDQFEYVRTSYCMALIFYYIRILQSLFILKNLGPKIIMIKKMVFCLIGIK